MGSCSEKLLSTRQFRNFTERKPAAPTSNLQSRTVPLCHLHETTATPRRCHTHTCKRLSLCPNLHHTRPLPRRTASLSVPENTAFTLPEQHLQRKLQSQEATISSPHIQPSPPSPRLEPVAKFLTIEACSMKSMSFISQTRSTRPAPSPTCYSSDPPPNHALPEKILAEDICLCPAAAASCLFG